MLVPPLPAIVATFCTGCEVMLAETSVTLRCAPPGSMKRKVWLSFTLTGKRPAFRVSTPAWVLSLTTSTPSTVRTSAPRNRLAGEVVAGEPGSGYPTTPRPGGPPDTHTHSAPY